MMQKQRLDRWNQPILPQHVSRTMSDSSLPAGETSSTCDDSSTESANWLSLSPNGGNKKNDTESYCLPTWSANPQSPGSDWGSHRGPLHMSSSSHVSSMMKPYSYQYQFARQGSILVMGFICIAVAAVVAPRATLNQAATQIDTFHTTSIDIQSKLFKFEQDIQKLERSMAQLDLEFDKEHVGFMAAKADISPSAEEDELHARQLSEMNELQSRLQNEVQQATYLKAQVQKISRNATIEKFGASDHFVELELVFPDNQSDGPTKFVIEMAPVDMMPHSVHTFLEIVSNGLFDGCSFILNALQVVKAAPLPYDGTSASDKAKAFALHGLESVSFKEYNKEYPHKKYTVGFAADGSPSFYINTADNSEMHVGDPCFGKVVSGFDTIQRLANSPTKNGIWFQQRIGIKSARIIDNISFHPLRNNAR